MSQQPTENLVEIIRSQARVETKLDMIIDRLDKSDAEHEKLKVRVSALEADSSRQKGFLAAIAGTAGVASGILVPVIRQKLGM